MYRNYIYLRLLQVRCQDEITMLHLYLILARVPRSSVLGSNIIQIYTADISIASSITISTYPYNIAVLTEMKIRKLFNSASDITLSNIQL